MNKKVEPDVGAAILVRRLDRNTLCGSSDQLLELVMSDKEKTHFLYRVGGNAVGAIVGESKYGGWIKLIGRFKAITSELKTFKSGTAFLPGDVATVIADKLKHDGGADSVSFLYDVYARYDTTIGPKYGFIIEPVRKPQEGDPLDLLFNDAKEMPLLLENQSVE